MEVADDWSGTHFSAQGVGCDDLLARRRVALVSSAWRFRAGVFFVPRSAVYNEDADTSTIHRQTLLREKWPPEAIMAGARQLPEPRNCRSQAIHSSASRFSCERPRWGTKRLCLG